MSTTWPPGLGVCPAGTWGASISKDRSVHSVDPYSQLRVSQPPSAGPQTPNMNLGLGLAAGLDRVCVLTMVIVVEWGWPCLVASTLHPAPNAMASCQEGLSRGCSGAARMWLPLSRRCRPLGLGGDVGRCRTSVGRKETANVEEVKLDALGGSFVIKRISFFLRTSSQLLSWY